MSTTEVPVPDGVAPATWRRYVAQLASSKSAVSRIAAVMQQEEAEVGAATAAQVASVEHLWRHLIQKYGVYHGADIATMRGAKASNRSVATNLAKREGLMGFVRGRAKAYPKFQFKGSGVHPSWRAVSAPLIDAGWDDEDILLWMVSPNVGLAGSEPAELIDTARLAEVVEAVRREAQGIW